MCFHQKKASVLFTREVKGLFRIFLSLLTSEYQLKERRKHEGARDVRQQRKVKHAHVWSLRRKEGENEPEVIFEREWKISTTDGSSETTYCGRTVNPKQDKHEGDIQVHQGETAGSQRQKETSKEPNSTSLRLPTKTAWPGLVFSTPSLTTSYLVSTILTFCPPVLLRYRWPVPLYQSKVYNRMIWYIYILRNDHHDKFS